jgi:ATP-dependent exoDNAse (exonuclease V) beta subunit
MRIDVVSASAGSGKTWRLTEELVAALLGGTARPEGVVAVTYTVKAAGELESRIRARLLEASRPDLAARIRDGYLGTIHSIGQRLLREFALEAELSPYLEPIPESERRRLFDVALSSVLRGREAGVNELARRLSIEDWKGPLLAIVDSARANGMDSASLRGSAAESRAGLSRLLPEPTIDGPTYFEALKRAHRKLQPKLEELSLGTVKEDKERAAKGRRLDAFFARGAMPPWKDQHQLAAAVGGRKFAGLSDELIALVGGHTRCAAFQADLFGALDALFDLAAQALGVFVAEKGAASVVDFGDMLAQAHELLTLPAVREALGSRLDLVLVDEFQDTSPLQLAVVGALGEIARRSVWVGDRKQAIFGFQGSDPELMAAAMEFALGGRPPAILGRSWRSRPALVQLCSGLFAAALAPHGYPEEQVRLTAGRADPEGIAGQVALECWRWSAETGAGNGTSAGGQEVHALAAGVAALLADPPLVRERGVAGDGGVERVRPAARRDVAILARSNLRCRQIAEALLARGIDARVSLAGVTQTPEGVLARAALALLADPQDGVAALEVGWLGGAASGDPDRWLSGRLTEVFEWRAAAEEARASGARPPPLPPPFGDDPRVAALRAAARLAARLSPAEALDVALRTAAVPERVRAWPEPGQRLANLEALREEAVAYERLCAAQKSAATVLGLVSHLADLGDVTDGEQGEQAIPSAEDAVTVCTWHAAKGLEWPIVVLSHLDFVRDRGVFDVAVEPAPSFDFARPLRGRWIRWWPWPYGKVRKELALLDAALRRPEAARTLEADLAERLRLLYVGFTRPRDLLVLAARVSDKGRGAAIGALDPLIGADGRPLLALPFSAEPGLREVTLGGERWPCRVRVLSGLPPAAALRPRPAIRWFAATPRPPRPRETVNPSAEPLPGDARIVDVFKLGPRLPVAAAAERWGSVGDAVHAFLAADRPGEAPPRAAMAARLLAAHGVAGALSPESLLSASGALRGWLEERFPGARWFREWPLRARLTGPEARLLVGEVDLFLELPGGLVLVDHKSFPGNEAERDRRLVEEYAPQLRWYARALTQALGKPLAAAFIHLPVRGEIAEVALG